MKIWIDADACPVATKDILFKAAERNKIDLVLVANKKIPTPRSSYITFILVRSGFNVADHEIVRSVEKGDLVITGDIPLAAEVIGKGGFALNPRGDMYSSDTIKERLSMRDFMDGLRSSGIDTGGPPVLCKQDIQAFANQLDAFINRRDRNKL